MPTPNARSQNCRRSPTSKRSSSKCAAKSRTTACISPRCGPRRRRWRAKPSLPSGGSRRSAATGKPGPRAWTAPPPTSPRSKRACGKPTPSVENLQDAPAAFAEKRTALITEIEAAEAARRAAADRLAAAENAQAEADRDARAALESLSAAREESARAEERFAGANRRLADIEHEIKEMLEIEPGAVAELGRDQAGRGAAERHRRRGQARPHPPRARAARRRQPARRGGIARGRDPARRPRQGARRSGRGDQAAAPGHPEPQPRGARAPAFLLRGGQLATSSTCSPSCSAAAPPSCN